LADINRVLKNLTHQLLALQSLTNEEVCLAVKQLVDEEIAPEPKAGFLAALAKKGETVEEITAFARELRARSIQPLLDAQTRSQEILDVCGTGGDRLNTFNISTTVALIAAAAGQYLVALIALVCAGALLGFLPYNFPGARAFLGDAGSHLIGYLLAILAILPHFYSRRNPEVLSVFKPLLILIVPLADLVWVVMLRWKSGRPFYIGDTNHLSHRLVRRGWSRTGAVLLIWLLAAVTGGLALL